MSTELKAGDTITAESLNGIAEGAYTFKSGEILTASKLNTIAEAIEDKDETIAEQAATIETQAGTIEEQAATIETQAATIIELREELAEVPTIEALNVTANGTYNEEGKAYKPVTVNVAGGGADIAEITITLTNNTNDMFGLIYNEDDVVNYYSHAGSYSKTINVPLHTMIEDGVEYYAAEIILAKCNGGAWTFDTGGYSETINVSSTDPDAIVVLPTCSLIIAKVSKFSNISVAISIT